MEDYELGRLAEELIEKRYGDKLKAKDDKINDLEKELEELKESRVYCREIIIEKVPVFGLDFKKKGSKPFREYKSIEGVNEEFNNLSKELELNKDRLSVVSKVNRKLDSFIHRNKLSSFIFKMWSDKNE